VVVADTVAVKAALLAPAGTVTDVGTETAALLLLRLIASPPAPAGVVSVTEHASFPAPVIDALLQLIALSAPAEACPVPLRLIVAEPAAVFAFSTTAPVTAPVAVGSKLSVRVAVCPGFRLSGKLAPLIPNSVPVTEPALIVRGAVPDEVRTTDWVDGDLRVTSPKAMLEELSVSPGTAAPSAIA